MRPWIDIRTEWCGIVQQKSAEVKSVLERYNPNLKMPSLDKVCMDIDPYLEMHLSDDNEPHDDIKNGPLAR